ncbi:hypothetical protein A3F03_02040 [Candidatus Roizmanbacteria bacterium RIFCSPHIGHO2_12_FULL_41_11]|uniref:Uncharacterized protein n=3 Tax=Candidatus Roizmaniibacteriota TaxID=1752723 RepID=A0A1F7JRM2_9BACT|nr:MAG: hypothetical protein A3F03_02040 [Candidatus Roizmanbacteria bacterium RIFCSPHIGHO2_12_FULL_41_11]OGK51366.1 MAG: hypothetical protein A2966_04570 [Candidatus Roizmanbacteria bacterium RIFCSPLOWO2_01_FULL_41_22]OGK58270.1 MAG: hypothetical protein A3H86_03500 [Candidatus Roizmanbacteria bacterium RIFCSPLOWO2_02_FULL_41_9]
MNKKELLAISIVIFLTIVAWIISDIYHTRSKTAMDEQIETALPQKKIDIKIFQVLEDKTP